MKEKGESAFEIEALENINYGKDESKTDYTEELKALKMLWEGKLLEKGISIYK